MRTIEELVKNCGYESLDALVQQIRSDYNIEREDNTELELDYDYLEDYLFIRTVLFPSEIEFVANRIIEQI